MELFFNIFLNTNKHQIFLNYIYIYIYISHFSKAIERRFSHGREIISQWRRSQFRFNESRDREIKFPLSNSGGEKFFQRWRVDRWIRGGGGGPRTRIRKRRIRMAEGSRVNVWHSNEEGGVYDASRFSLSVQQPVRARSTGAAHAKSWSCAPISDC